MKIIKLADVDDFMEGAREYDLQALPPQEQLDSNQIKFIKEKTLNLNSSNLRVKYFLKYPKYAYIAFYDINEIASYNPNTARDVFNLWINLPNQEISVPKYVTNNELAELVVKNWDKFEDQVSSIDISDSLAYSESNSPIFINFLNKKYPYLSKKEDPNKLFYNFFNLPSNENYAKIKLAIDKRQIANLKDIYKKTINSDTYSKNIKNALERKRHYKDYYEENSSTILNELNILRKKYYDGENYEYDIFNLIISENDFGEIKNILIGDKFVDISAIENIILTIQQKDNQYWRIYSDNREFNYDMEDSNYDSKEKEIYLVDEEQNIYPIEIPEKLSENISYSYGESILTPLINKISYSIPAKDNVSSIKEWVESVKQSNNFSSEDQMYLYLVKSEPIKKMTEKAGEHIFSEKIQNGKILSEEAWESEEKHHWTENPPYFIDYAWDFWSSVPQTVLQSLGKNDIPSWFLFFSGVFTPQVIKSCAYSIGELGKHIDNVQTYSSDEEHDAFVSSIKQEIEKKNKKDLEIFEKLWPDFLKNNITKQYMSDYPEIFKYVKKVIDINLSTENQYGDKKDLYQQAYDKALKMPIYIINRNDFINTFGDNDVSFFPSPKKANGFFSNGSYLFDYKPSIVVYSGGLDNDVGNILNELGITADSSLEINEENVLWHEIAHAIHHILVPNRSYDTNLDDSSDEWLTSPDEIFAISYGNLAHIKKIIRQYFEKNLLNNPKITYGLLSQIKSDIVKTFSFEFQGMKKEEALQMIQESMPEFDEEALDSLNSMSENEKVSSLTKLFSSFFLRKFMRSKVEDSWKDILKNTSKSIEFKEEIKIPEKEEQYNPYQKDKFIIDLEKRPDYQKFIEDAKILANNYRNKEELKPYLHRDMQTIREPTSLIELNLFIFGAPSLISSVDTNGYNYIFDEIVPQSLRSHVKEIVDREKQLLSGQKIYESKSPVTPEEADEAGEFIAEMDEEYGPDWMWLAKNKNWYKTAQEQVNFDFYDEIGESFKEESEFESDYFENLPKTVELLEEILYDVDGDDIESIKKILDQYRFEYNVIDFQNNLSLITVTINNELYLLQDGELYNPQEWIWRLSEDEILEYIPPPPEESFWESVGNALTVYHATHPDNIESILENGLEVRNESRGISNRWTPSAVFTSLNPEETDSYGSKILEIDVGQMKSDGYMPRASYETPIEIQNAEYALAHKIGLENYIPQSELSSDGISESTIVFYDSIPSKYISEYN